MSVVLAVCNLNFFTIMSDGRVVQYNNKTPFDEDDYTIISENFSKIKRVNENWAIGISGDGSLAFNIFEDIENRPAYKQLALNKVAVKIMNLARKQVKVPLNTTIIFGGKDLNGNFSMYVMNSKNDFELIEFIARGTKTSIYGAYPKLPPEINISDNFSDSISKCNSIECIYLNMEKCIKLVSKVNRTVNRTIFSETIINERFSWKN